MTPTEMIRAILKVPEWTQAKIADELTVTQPTVHRWLKGADPEGKHYDPIRRLYEEVTGKKVVRSAQKQPPRTTAIPDLAIFAGMGGGGFLEVNVDDDGAPIDPDQVRGYWEFPEYMLRRFGNLRNIYAWEVRGDSMEPTLAGGSVVFVDTSQRALPPDDIYALDAGDGLVVKRLRLVPRTDRIEIISDNEDRYPRDKLLREEVTIWGRVIGWFQWRG